jgi:sporulation protein YlmC with PRC-barrel domain
MLVHRLLRIAVLSAAITCTAAASATAREPLIKPVVPLSQEVLYAGWRASDLLGSDVLGGSGQDLGRLSNLVLDDSGSIRAIIVTTTGEGDGDSAYRVAWADVRQSALPDRIVADVKDPRAPAYNLFAGDQPADNKEFPVTEVTGEYARLQPGLAYGYVSDVVFTPAGDMAAVLVTRSAADGGGTFAFGFPGRTGRWDPRMSYYGLPYLTPEQASRSAIRVDSRRFRASSG